MDNVTKVLQDVRVNERGINEIALDKVIVDIYDYCDKLRFILSQINDLVAGTSDYYKCSEADAFRRKYEIFSRNFPTLLDSVISYAEDLVGVKTNYTRINEDITTLVKTGTTNVIDTKVSEYHENR